MESSEDNSHATKITRDFITWYTHISNKEKEFASVLMIANLSDDKLERVKLLTKEYA